MFKRISDALVPGFLDGEISQRNDADELIVLDDWQPPHLGDADPPID